MKHYKIFLGFLLWSIPIALSAQSNMENPLADTLVSAAKRFATQLNVFPQEKAYLQTDKPYYLSGERIWFRTHVVDAATHVPSFASGSVFVELFDSKNSVVCRVKTGINNIYSGYIDIPEETPEGDYVIRAYTAGMRNLDEDYFFLKSIRIGDPMARLVRVVPEFEFLPDNKIGALFRFSSLNSPSPLTLDSLKVTVNNQKTVELKCIDGKSGLNFNLPPAEKQRVMLLNAVYEKRPYLQYIKIPLPDDDFDVSFFPEGGSALFGCEGRMAFKAMQPDGTEIDVEGKVYDRKGNEITQFRTDMRSMGQFRMKYEPDEAYYAICTNSKGQSKRFELPAAKKTGYALSASWGRDRLAVNVVQPESQKKGDTLFLLVHTRGIVDDIFIWSDTNTPLVFQKDFFPSGVSHLLLLTKNMIPVSERLVFVDKDDQAKVECTTDKDAYSLRSPVEYTVNITDKTGKPLRGNFSVSVTDGSEVAPDTTSNILTSLLLSSDLHGNITDPAFYFHKNNRSLYALDLLMLTQGWRRYDTERIMKNDFLYPDTILSKGYELSGMVRTTSGQKPVGNVNVSAISMKGDFANGAFTDSIGRFFMPDSETPDSTWLVVQTSRQNLELLLNEATYPDRKIPVVAPGVLDSARFVQYLDKAEKLYTSEHGIRTLYLPEVSVTAQKKIAVYSSYYKAHDITFSITDKDIEKNPPVNILFLLRRVPGISVDMGNGSLSITRGRESVVVTVNDMPAEMSLNMLQDLVPSQVLQIDLVYGPGSYLSNGATPWLLSVVTRMKNLSPRETPYIKYIKPLGFQKPVEFYAPKYDAANNDPNPDLRTTIHWNPNITTDEAGKASFSFYTADAPSTYTVVIEGMTADGEIVYHKDFLKIGNK